MKKRAHLIVSVYLDFFWGGGLEGTMQICIQIWIINVAKNVLPMGLFSLFHPLVFVCCLKTLCLYPAAFNLSPASLHSWVAGCGWWEWHRLLWLIGWVSSLCQTVLASSSRISWNKRWAFKGNRQLRRKITRMGYAYEDVHIQLEKHSTHSIWQPGFCSQRILCAVCL